MLSPLALGARAAMLLVRVGAVVGIVTCAASRAHAPPSPLPAPADTTEPSDPSDAVLTPPTADVPPAEPSPLAPLTVDYDLSDLTMVTPKVGWATRHDVNTDSSLILRTEDGGDTFAITGPVVEAGTVCGYAFVDANQARVIVCTGRADVRLIVHRTSDGGKTWSYAPVETSDEPGTPLGVESFEFRDALHGSFVTTLDGDEDRLPEARFRTSDGGLTWKEIGLVSNTRVRDADDTRAWALDGGSYANAALLRADDGKTFKWVPDLTGCTVEELPTFFGARGWVAASCGTQARRFAHTTDGGEHWTLGEDTDEEAAFDFLDGDHAWSVGKNGTFATDDGGRTWSKRDEGPREAVSVTMLSPTVGFLQVLTDEEPVLLRTTDGGRSWHTALGFPSTGADSLDLDAVDATNVFVYLHGPRGTQLYRSRDGGASFTFASAF